MNLWPDELALLEQLQQIQRGYVLADDPSYAHLISFGYAVVEPANAQQGKPATLALNRLGLRRLNALLALLQMPEPPQPQQTSKSHPSV